MTEHRDRSTVLQEKGKTENKHRINAMKALENSYYVFLVGLYVLHVVVFNSFLNNIELGLISFLSRRIHINLPFFKKIK